MNIGDSNDGINTNNMNLFDINDEIKHYDDVNGIFDDFYDMRHGIYVKRKAFLIAKYENELSVLEWKMKFINQVIDETIVVFRQKQSAVIARLEELKYPKFKIIKSVNDTKDDDDDEEGSSSGSYSYLTVLKLFHMTEEKIAELQALLDIKQAELNHIRVTTVEEQWLTEINEFEEAYDAWLIKEPETKETVTIGKKSKKNIGKRPALKKK